jgi:hypothetical protein
MATLFKNKLKSEIGITEETVLTTEANAKTTVVGLSLTNLGSSIVLASVKIVDTVTNDTAFFLKETVVPPNQSLRVINGGERLVLGPSTSVKIASSAEESLDCILSYVEII